MFRFVSLELYSFIYLTANNNSHLTVLTFKQINNNMHCRKNPMILLQKHK